MNGKASIVALLGLGLLGTRVFGESGATLRNSVSNVNGGPDQAAGHKAVVQFLALIAGVVIACVLASASDTAATAIIWFFVLLWVLWGMSNTNLTNDVTKYKTALKG